MSPEPDDEEVSVCTVAATAVATGHLMLKLEGYSQLKATHGENGSYVESCSFKVGDHTWTVRCYLNGDSKKDAGFVSLFLYLCNHAGAAVHAEFEFALLPHQDDDTPPAAAAAGSNSSYSWRSPDAYTFGGKDKNRGWGRGQFIAVEKLERSVFLRDDCLAVRCTVTVVRQRTVKEKAVQPEDMVRLGIMLCKCDDELCKRRHAHARPAAAAAAAAAETLLERFANFCSSICRGVHVGQMKSAEIWYSLVSP